MGYQESYVTASTDSCYSDSLISLKELPFRNP